MRRARDSQRGKVYRSERELPWSIDVRQLSPRFPVPEDRIGSGSMEEVTVFVHKVWKWAFDKGMARYSQPPRIKDGRGTTIARGGAYVLNLPRWARGYTVVLHEVAHSIVNTYDSRAPWHGREFCRVYLRLMKRWHPKRGEAAKLLRERFKANRVKYTRKREMTPEQLRKLRERGRQLAAARRLNEQGQS